MDLWLLSISQDNSVGERCAPEIGSNQSSMALKVFNINSRHERHFGPEEAEQGLSPFISQRKVPAIEH